MKAVKSNLNVINKRVIKSVFFGVTVGCLLIIILMILSAVIFLQTGKYPAQYLNIMTLIFLGTGALAGGYITGRLRKASGLAYGAVTGGIMFAIVFVSGLSKIGAGLTVMCLLKLVVLTVFAALGGILGVNKKKKIKI